MAANLSNSTLTTNFNIEPYHDDYDSNKFYYRTLFKPGYAVQARELTQIQTTLQKQIDRVGKHLFREGSIVLPGAFTLEAGHCEANGQICTGDSIPYVRIKDVDTSNSAVSISSYKDQIIYGTTNYVKAIVVDVADGIETSGNTKTLFVRYLTASNTNGSIVTFLPNENLSSNVGTLTVLANNHVAGANAIGLGARFEIEEGVFFAKEHFIAFPKQSIILDKYNHIPSCKVGFLVTEKIINSSLDISLLDPALESSNYSAPGADRLQLYPTLDVTSYDDPIGPPDFVTLFTIKEGLIDAIFDRSQYNILQDELAKRTYDESGDYYVYGAGVQIREHDDTGSNFGKYANGNNQLLFVGVDPGLLYVKGYEIGILDTVPLSTEKSLTYSNVNSQIVSSTMGSYLTVNELTGTWELDKSVNIDLYDTAQKRITDKKWSVTSQSGNKIGSAILSSVEYASGTEGYDAQYYIYLSDIKMLGSNTFSNVRSLYIDNASVGDAGADVILDVSNNAVLQGLNETPLLYFVGSNFVRNVKSISDPTLSDTTFKFNQTEGVSSSLQIQSNGSFTISISPGDEIFPYGSGSLSAADKREIRLSINQSLNIGLPGTVSATAGQKTLVGLSTFFSRLNVGDKIEVAGKSNTFYISAIANNTNLTVTENFPTGISGNAIFKAFKTGDLIDMTAKGSDSGTTRTVTSTTTSLSFDIKETLGTSVGATVTYQLARTSAKEISKLLRSNRYVVINCASSSASTNGAYDLGFSDVYRVKSIRLKNSSAPSSNTDGTDVLGSFFVDKGQRDNYYDHATITPKTNFLTNTDYLLVELDYFQPSFTGRAGYFSVDSYPVQDNDALYDPLTNIRTENIPLYKSPVTGKEYDLRNHLDFRPIKTNTSTDATTPGSASVNPAISTTFNYTTGMRYPVPATDITFDYSYYLARKDLVVVDKNKNFSIIKGIPAVVPITPEAQDNTMALAVIDIPPYPSLSPAYGRSINRTNLACRSRRIASVRFTMRDIGVLKERIVNLEYYTTLSLLEKQAADMRILDENGIDRFKNGIFVDTFRDHLLGATYNSDYRITVDPIEKSIRSLYTMDSFGYNYLTGTNVAKSNDVITLAYTEVTLLTQNNATTIRNIERTSFRFFGNMTIIPDQDTWVDTTFLPDESVTLGPSLEDIAALGISPTSATAYALVGPNVDIPGPELVLTTEWGAWQAHVTGYKVYEGSGASRIYRGTYGTYDAARNAANQYTNNTDATIETLYNNVRTGTEQFLTELTDSATLGYKVVDTSIVPYIRPQTIAIRTRGLKPYTKMNVFFDGEKANNYCTPLLSSEYDLYVFDGPKIQVKPNANEGDQLTVDANGELFFLFRIDSNKKYRFGMKSIVVTDSPTNAEDATTGSKGFFNAQGLSVSKQRSILSTRDVIPLQREVQESYNSSGFEVVPRVVPTGGGGGGGCKSCLAYTIIPKAPAGEEGIFLTSVDIFIAEKSPDRGIWFEIREINDGGNITRNSIPFSQVWYNSNEVPISTDGKTNPLNVKFRAPIFLYNNVQYAFVIHTEGIDRDYYIWVSRLGETDVNTGKPVNSRALKGTLFTTQNNTNWDIVPDVDLTCVFKRAEFNKDLIGTATLANKPAEKILLKNLTGSFSGRIGDTFITGDTITITSANGTISANDVLIGNVSSFNANVIAVESSTVYRMTDTGYRIGEKVDVFYNSNGAYKGVSATVSGIANGIATLSRYSETSFSKKAIFINSNGNFKANDRIKSVEQGNTYSATIHYIDNFRYSVVSFEPSYLKPILTDIKFEMRTYSNTGSLGSFVFIEPSSEYYFTSERALYSKSREVSDLSSANTNQIRITMSTLSNTVSPFVDLARTHNIYIDNIINSNTTNETNASGGELFNKYISKTVTLAEGQDAEDLHVVLTAYRPPGTNVKVYAKILHAEDADLFVNKPWIELEKSEGGDSTYSSLVDRNDFKEFTFDFPASVKTGSQNQVQYTNSAGTKFTGFKYFAIKIGLLDDNNTAVVPRVADLRCIALQI